MNFFDRHFCTGLFAKVHAIYVKELKFPLAYIVKAMSLVNPKTFIEYFKIDNEISVLVFM